MASGDERIALNIETRADLSGIQAVRGETNALAQAAKQATEQVTVTADQEAAAWKRAGGSISVFNTEIRKLVEQERALTASARAAAAELTRQAAAGAARPTAGSAQLGPALPGLTAAAAAEASDKALQKIPTSARQAGNALNLLAASAANGTGSLTGLTLAAGNVAQGMLSMSSNAKIAASAAGIGALTASVAILIALSIEAYQKLKEIPQGAMSNAAAAHLKNLHDEVAVQSALAGLDARRAALQEQLLSYGGLFGGQDALSKQKATLQAIVDIDAQRLALTERAVEVREEDRARGLRAIAIEAAAQTTATGRYAGQLRVIEAERKEAIRTHELTETAANQRAATQRRLLSQEGDNFVLGLMAERAAAELAVNDSVWTQRRLAADTAFEKERRDIEQNSKLSRDDRRAALEELQQKHDLTIDLIGKERDAGIAASFAARAAADEDPSVAYAARLLQIEQERVADEKRLGALEAQAVADKKLRDLQKQRIQEGLGGYAALSAAVRNHGTVVGAIGKATADAISLYEIAKKGKSAWISAQMEWAAASAAYAIGNLPGAALHGVAAGGYAAAALAAGAEAYGVLHSGGGSGGTGSSGAGDSTVFQPRDSTGGGGMTLILQTVNPYSKEAISEVQYQLGRAGVLKRPIPIAPTTGLQGAA